MTHCSNESHSKSFDGSDVAIPDEDIKDEDYKYDLALSITTTLKEYGHNWHDY